MPWINADQSEWVEMVSLQSLAFDRIALEKAQLTAEWRQCEYERSMKDGDSPKDLLEAKYNYQMAMLEVKRLSIGVELKNKEVEK